MNNEKSGLDQLVQATIDLTEEVQNINHPLDTILSKQERALILERLFDFHYTPFEDQKPGEDDILLNADGEEFYGFKENAEVDFLTWNGIIDYLMEQQFKRGYKRGVRETTKHLNDHFGAIREILNTQF